MHIPEVGSRDLAARIAAARTALDAASGVEADDAVEHLARARVLLDAALDEAMAEALLAGTTLRAVAERAGLAPNSVPPRLARTTALGPYRREDGRVGAEGVTRARYDVERGLNPPAEPEPIEPLRFRRRRS